MTLAYTKFSRTCVKCLLCVLFVVSDHWHRGVCWASVRLCRKASKFNCSGWHTSHHVSCVCLHLCIYLCSYRYHCAVQRFPDDKLSHEYDPSVPYCDGCPPNTTVYFVFDMSTKLHVLVAGNSCACSWHNIRKLSPTFIYRQRVINIHNTLLQLTYDHCKKNPKVISSVKPLIDYATRQVTNVHRQTHVAYTIIHVH